MTFFLPWYRNGIIFDTKAQEPNHGEGNGQYKGFASQKMQNP
jgi:hypothetical protein